MQANPMYQREARAMEENAMQEQDRTCWLRQLLLSPGLVWDDLQGDSGQDWRQETG